MDSAYGRQRGFTLVEIAIVLVIIGLLLGGILKGQEMIVQAKTKNVITDFSGVSAAYHGYFDRYRKTPGDDGDANARWTLGIAAPAGAGAAYNDGKLTGAYNSSTANEEPRLFWLHLRKSGFVTGDGQAQPLNAAGGLVGVQTGNAGAGGTVLGGFAGLMMCSASLPDKIAIAVDSQMDDGKPDTGMVRAQDVVGAIAAAVTGYIETGTNTYTVCRSF